MRAALVIFTLFFSTNVFAEEAAPAATSQKDDCGVNMTQVANIVDSKFKDANLSSEQVYQLVGNWGMGLIIKSEEDFKFGGKSLKVCPQADGRFYIEGTDDKAISGYLVIKDPTKIKLENFAGAYIICNRDFTKQPEGTVATGEPRRQQKKSK